MRKIDKYNVTRDGDKQHRVAYQHRWVMDNFSKGLDYEDVIVLGIETYRNKAFKKAVVYNMVDDTVYVIERFGVKQVGFTVELCLDGRCFEYETLTEALFRLSLQREYGVSEHSFVFLVVEGDQETYVWDW